MVDIVVVEVSDVRAVATTKIVQAIAVDTTAGLDTTAAYYYVCTAALVLTLPTPVGRSNSYHARNLGSGNVTIAAPTGLIEDGDNVTLYPGESMQLFSVNGMWRLF